VTEAAELSITVLSFRCSVDDRRFIEYDHQRVIMSDENAAPQHQSENPQRKKYVFKKRDPVAAAKLEAERVARLKHVRTFLDRPPILLRYLSRRLALKIHMIALRMTSARCLVLPTQACRPRSFGANFRLIKMVTLAR
jgi:hypothetical protein